MVPYPGTPTPCTEVYNWTTTTLILINFAEIKLSKQQSGKIKIWNKSKAPVGDFFYISKLAPLVTFNVRLQKPFQKDVYTLRKKKGFWVGIQIGPKMTANLLL